MSHISCLVRLVVFHPISTINGNFVNCSPKIKNRDRILKITFSKIK